MKKYLILCLMLVILLPLLGGVAWYCFSYLPHVSEINYIVTQGDSIVSSAPHVLYDIAIADGSKESIRTYAIQQAYWHLGRNENPGKMLLSQLNESLWLLVSYLHFSEKQVFSIWVYYAPYEGGRGLKDASLYYFKKPLSDLDERSLAALVVVVRSPSRYKPGTERSERRIEQIFKKLKTS